MPSGTTLPLCHLWQPVLPQKTALPPTFLYHAITREEEKRGGSGWLFPQVAVSMPTSIKHLLLFLSGFFSPELRDGEIFMLSRKSYFSNQGRFYTPHADLTYFRGSAGCYRCHSLCYLVIRVKTVGCLRSLCISGQK